MLDADFLPPLAPLPEDRERVLRAKEESEQVTLYLGGREDRQREITRLLRNLTELEYLARKFRMKYFYLD